LLPNFCLFASETHRRLNVHSMMLFSKVWLCSLAVSLVSASPSSTPRSKRCTITSKYSSSNGTADDSPAVASAFAKCSTNSVIVFSEGVNYNIFKPISAKNLSNVAIEVQGNLRLPQNITYIQAIVNASNALTYSTSLYWFTFAGPSIDLSVADKNRSRMAGSILTGKPGGMQTQLTGLERQIGRT
jgi:hypothetical protein